MEICIHTCIQQMLYAPMFVYEKEEIKDTDEMPVFQFNFMS